MKNGTIILTEPSGYAKGIERIVEKCIQFFTGSSYTHVKLYFRGLCYHSYAYYNPQTKRVMHGFAATSNVSGSLKIEPVRDMTRGDCAMLHDYIARELLQAEPYNFIKLVTLAVIYPTRWFWRLIGRVPFSSELLGRVCSTRVDEMVSVYMGDLFPDDLQGYSVPGDYPKLLDTEDWQLGT